ncbi:MAG: hypothetical protein JNK78_00550 [Planctomycetes bacterium]|nr:hypothetical protein [Planctomycetota bacterium]
MRHALLLALSVCTTPLLGQTLVLPDNHNFMEATNYGTNAGDNNCWATAARRFQIVYEASHFTGKAGIQPGGVLITHVKFRGEDGEANLGGQIYSNVTVELGSTSITGATMSTTFATNRAPGTATMGALGTVPAITLAPSIGSCPNNYCIDIDLLAIGAAFVYDPHNAAQPNLLIDITIPTAPTQVVPQSLIPLQDTTAHGAGIRGNSVWTATIGAATGTADTTPPVVGIEFLGAGGWATEMPARAELIGGGCGGQHSTVYQAFTQDQAFDLGSGITFFPDVYPSPNYYTVVTGAAPFDVTQINAAPNSTGDDAVITHNLGFLVTPFQYPGGSTTQIKPSTNGFVWLDPAMTATQNACTKGNMLGTSGNFTARLMPFWTDLTASRNTGMGTGAGLHVKTVPETAPGAGDAICYVTWRDQGSFRTPVLGGSPTVFGHEVFNVQMVMHEQTGIVEFRYGTMQPFVSTLWANTLENAAIVGFTRGRISTTPLVASLDPQSRDLSHELPVATSVEGTVANVALTAVATPVAGSVHQTGRMFGGQSLTWNIANVPGPTFAFLNLDVGASQPGLQLPPGFGILAPTCMMSTTPNPVVLGWESWFVAAPGTTNLTGTIPLAVPHGWEGVVITAQAIGVDLFGGPFLIPWASNTIKYTVGLD